MADRSGEVPGLRRGGRQGQRLLRGDARLSTSLRAERAEDAPTLWALHEAAFGRPDEAKLVARLREAASPLVSLVAEDGARVIGHVLFSPVTLEGGRGSPPAGGLAPVAVLPEAQRRGAGSALICAGLEAARALGWELVFVLGNPAYYGRFGFGLAAPHGLHYESHDFDVAFQVQALGPGGIGGARGWVRYHPAFAELGA